MLTDALLAYFHFAAIITLACVLAVELALCMQAPSGQQLRQLAAIDRCYGLSALVVIATGAARMALGVKGSAFYLHNPVFYAKMALFVAVGLISIVPTFRFIRWSKELKSDPHFVVGDAALTGMRRLIVIQFIVLAMIPLAATLMARGLLV